MHVIDSQRQSLEMIFDQTKGDIGPKGRFRFLNSNKYVPSIMHGDKSHEIQMLNLMQKKSDKYRVSQPVTSKRYRS